jgi:hypothetical protein
MKTVQGYDLVNCISQAVIVSEKEGKRIRQKELEEDKKHGGVFIPGTNIKKLRINPNSYTEEEEKFMKE